MKNIILVFVLGMFIGEGIKIAGFMHGAEPEELELSMFILLLIIAGGLVFFLFSRKQNDAECEEIKCEDGARKSDNEKINILEDTLPEKKTKNEEREDAIIFEVLDEVCFPERATEYSVGADLYAREACVIKAGETKIVPLGIKINLNFIAKSIWEEQTGECITDEKAFVEDFKNWDIDNLDKNNSDDMNKIVFSRQLKKFLASHFFLLEPRSSTRTKGVVMLRDDKFSDDGIIDMDYPGEIGIVLHNLLKFPSEKKEGENKTLDFGSAYEIKKGDKIAQIILQEHKSDFMGIKSRKAKRTSGFGSTGK